jgi:hypothetical protein
MERKQSLNFVLILLNIVLQFLAKALSKIPVINTSLDYDADTIKYEFDYMLQNIAKSLLDTRESDELNIMNG